MVIIRARIDHDRITLLDFCRASYPLASGFDVSPVWFLLINQGLYILYVCLFMRLFEFRMSADLHKYARNSTFLRRWGLLALSVYMFQLLDIYPRKLFTMMTGMDFITHGNANMLWSCIFMIVAAFYFDVILRLWEKSGFLYLIILLPILPILAIFPKTRKNTHGTMLRRLRKRIISYLVSNGFLSSLQKPFPWFSVYFLGLWILYYGNYNIRKEREHHRMENVLKKACCYVEKHHILSY